MFILITLGSNLCFAIAWVIFTIAYLLCFKSDYFRYLLDIRTWVYVIFNTLNVFFMHKVVLPCTQNTDVPLGKKMKDWVAEKGRLQAAKGNEWLYNLNKTQKKITKCFRRGICLIAAPGEVIYVPTSYVDFMCLLVCYSIEKCVLTMATPISPDTLANFESHRAPSQSNTQTSHQIPIAAKHIIETDVPQMLFLSETSFLCFMVIITLNYRRSL